MKLAIPFVALALLGAAASHANAPSPYAGQEGRDIKALSASEVDDLLAGKGMGYAKAAELNGYPGPAHVLELAQKLGLSAEQRSATQAIFQRMDASARKTGAELVAAERELDTLFRGRRATPEALAASLDRVAALQAKVRYAHLEAHVDQARLLSAEQIALYNTLRGYTGAAPEGKNHHHGHK